MKFISIENINADKFFKTSLTTTKGLAKHFRGGRIMFRQFTFRDFPLCIDFQYKSNKRALDLENFNQERLKEEGRKMILVEGPSRATKSLLQDLSVLLEKVETLDYPKERKVSEIQEFVKLRELILSIFVIQCGEIEENYCQDNYGLYARENIYNLNRKDIDAIDSARRQEYHEQQRGC